MYLRLHDEHKTDETIRMSHDKRLAPINFNTK